MELLRTKRLLGLGVVFLFFAITSPLLARYMTEFIALLVPADEAIGLLIPDPVWTDSYAQFYSNISQIGNITLIFLLMGAIASEKQLGTADLLLTKGLGYGAFVLTKFTVIAVAVVLTILVSGVVVHFYTVALFETAGGLAGAILGTLAYSLFLLLIVALTLFCGAIAKSTVFTALLAFLGFLAISALSALPRVGDYLPGNLLARSMELTGGVLEWDATLWGPLGTTLGLTVVLLAVTVLVLRKQEGA